MSSVSLSPAARSSSSEKNGQRCRSVAGGQSRAERGPAAVAPHAERDRIPARCGKRCRAAAGSGENNPGPCA